MKKKIMMYTTNKKLFLDIALFLTDLYKCVKFSLGKCVRRTDMQPRWN